MGKFKKVLVLEVEEAKDKNPETPGGKYRRDTPWLVESFKKKGHFKDIESLQFFQIKIILKYMKSIYILAELCDLVF